jgi:isochorismate synthase
VEISPEHINLFFKRCKVANSAGVIYSLPVQTEFEILLEDRNAPTKDPLFPFIFFPFDQTKEINFQLNPQYKNENAIEFLSKFSNENGYWIHPSLAHIHTTSREEYEENFKNYQTEIQTGICTKAILSTIVQKEIPVNFNVGEYILKLRNAYPQAFIYLFSSAETGTWIGATPETLLKWEQREVSTMSLAGTKKNNDNDSQFGTKERDEQEIVTDYIRRIFERRFSNVKTDPTAKLSYGEMEHLITRVEASTESSFSKNDLLDLAADLHPTPAVGGYPKKEATDLIKKTEIHPRLYYSGYLGAIHSNSAHLVVNLRCMCLGEELVYAFAGGGIIKDSLVEAEWEETRLKAQALLKFL